MSDPVVSIETITPQIAQEWLAVNRVNRTLRKNRVASYEDQMRRGLWKLTGEPIQRNGDSLLNGQHRLTACVQSGVSFRTVVVRGVAEDAMTVMDSGLPRSVSDALRFAGVSNTYQVAAVARSILLWQRGIIRDTSRGARELSRDDIVAFCLENDARLDAAKNQGRRISQAIGLPPSPWGVFCYLVSEVDGEVAGQFVDLLISGDGLARGNALFALRTWVVSSSAQRRHRATHEIVAVAIKAWNAWLTDQEVGLLKFLPTEDLPEVLQP